MSKFIVIVCLVVIFGALAYELGQPVWSALVDMADALHNIFSLDWIPS